MSTEKDTNILIRVSKKEKEHIASRAAAAGITLSAYARTLLSGGTIQARTDAAVLSELRRLGGLVKYAFSNGANSAATSAALKSLEQAAARLAR